MKVTIIGNGGISFEGQNVHFQPAANLTEVAFDGKRYYYNSDGELVAFVEPDVFVESK